MNNILYRISKPRLYLVKILLAGSVLAIIFNSACQQAKAPSSRSMLSELLRDRYTQGDTIPLSDSILLSFLPNHLPGYLETIINGSTFNHPKKKFSYAEKTYLGRDRLSITISDYAADTTSYLTFWQLYNEYLAGSSSKTFSQSEPFSFGWTEMNPNRQTITRYIALKQRFWVEIKLNYHDSLGEYKSKELDKAYQALKKGLL